jgi:hypothetical protein
MGKVISKLAFFGIVLTLEICVVAILLAFVRMFR